MASSLDRGAATQNATPVGNHAAQCAPPGGLRQDPSPQRLGHAAALHSSVTYWIRTVSRLCLVALEILVCHPVFASAGTYEVQACGEAANGQNNSWRAMDMSPTTLAID